MDTSNQRGASAHLSAFHEDQLALFDAYLTDELDEDERRQVEQHLQECQECQQLFAEVTQLRDTLGTLLATGQSSARTRTHSPQLVHAVMASIEQREKRGGQFTSDTVKQIPALLRKPDTSGFLAQKRVKLTYLGIGAAVLCLLLFVGLLILFRPATPLGNGQRSEPDPVVWITQQPILVQNSAGVFALKEIEVTTEKEFRFYYAFQSSHQSTLHVAAVSVLTGDQRQPITLSTTVLPLGTIDGISVGVIRVQYLDRVGQTITLHITSPTAVDGRWQLTPLKQIAAEPNLSSEGYYTLTVDQRLFPEIIWSGPNGPLKSPHSSHYSMSEISLFKNAAGTHYVFLLVNNYIGKISVITREQCLQLALAGNQICH